MQNYQNNEEKNGEMSEQKNLKEIFKRGLSFAKEGDYESAKQQWEQSAEKGHKESLYNLGLLYYRGLVGVKKDCPKAVENFLKAAKQGYKKAQYDLVFLLEEGYPFFEKDRQVVENYKIEFRSGDGYDSFEIGKKFYHRDHKSKKAKEWFNSAASYNDDVQYKLGKLYYDGMHPDSEESREGIGYYEQAEKNGNVDAQYELGKIYYNCMHPNSKESRVGLRYYKLAAVNGKVDAQYELGIIYYDGMHPDSEKSREGIGYYEQAAENGNLDALYHLGKIYYDYMHRDSEESLEGLRYYEQAAEQGHINALKELINLYNYYGKSRIQHIGEATIEEKYVQLAEWCRKAADQGNPEAQSLLVFDLYIEGHAMNEDCMNVAQCYLPKLVEEGDAEKKYKIGCFYRDGKYLETDYEKAAEWFIKAADQGLKDEQLTLCLDALLQLIDLYEKDLLMDNEHILKAKQYQEELNDPKIQFELGCCYRDGKVGDRNYEKSEEWFLKAAEQEYADAQYSLGRHYESRELVDENALYLAIKWYKEAAGQGHIEALRHVVNIYNNLSKSRIQHIGKATIEKDYAQFAKWSRDAAEQGDSVAQHLLVFDLYLKKHNMNKDCMRAAQCYLQKMAEEGNEDAQFEYAEGLVVKKDYPGAAKWYRKVADHDYLSAQSKLRELYEKNQSECEVLFYNGSEMSNSKLNIKEHISKIYDDFFEEMKKPEIDYNLCLLRDVKFEKSNDNEANVSSETRYNAKLKQQYYLLRYEFGHIYIYKCMYLHMLDWMRDNSYLPEVDESETSKKDFGIKVTSIGCGNFTDYWGLMEAIYERRPLWAGYKVDYTGIDLEEWPYLNLELAKKNGPAKFIQGDATKYLSGKAASRWTTSDAFIFPFSIGEIGTDDLQIIAENIAKRSQNDVVCILISYGSDEESKDYYLKAAEQLYGVMKENGWEEQDRVNQTEDSESDEITYENGEFDKKEYGYPVDKEVIKKLYKKCKFYGREELVSLDDKAIVCLKNEPLENCKKDFRSPMFKKGTIRYQIVFFKKKMEE